MGRVLATAGDVLVHPILDCHANRIVSSGVKLIRLQSFDSTEIGGLYRLDEVDTLARIAERDVVEAGLMLQHYLQQKRAMSPGIQNDWPDALARDLAQNTLIGIGNWAEANGLARETVSRGFAVAYGIPPKVFRAELRARAAWLRVIRRSEQLCVIAAETGFADQAHMTRWITRITGDSPASWRRNFQQHGIGKQICLA